MIARGPPCSVFAFAKLREIRSGESLATIRRRSHEGPNEPAGPAVDHQHAL
jgi:hypothetical protein